MAEQIKCKYFISMQNLSIDHDRKEARKSIHTSSREHSFLTWTTVETSPFIASISSIIELNFHI